MLTRYIEDREFATVHMDKKDVLVGKNVHRFRMQLMNKILSRDFDSDATSDLVCDDVYGRVLLETARQNTEAYHAVFPEFPHSSYLSMKQYDEVSCVAWRGLGVKVSLCLAAGAGPFRQ